MPMRVTLSVVEGPHEGESFDFEGHDLFLVGRSNQAHLQLRDPYFSRVHFMIEVNPPLCRLTDMNSHNGTYVNGERVKTAPLKDGDRIRAGHTVMRVLLGADSVPTLDADQPPPEGEVRTVQSAVPQAWQPGAMPAIPGYTLSKVLGRGGMGTVYLARRDADGAQVAVKTVMPAAGDPRQVQRFLREADILRQLDHPHIVRFLDLGDADGLLYFVMEHVRGTDLQKVAGREKLLKAAVAVRILCQVLEGLAHAHAKGFVHRDIKPANVLIEDLPRGGRRAKVADFGLGRIYKASRISGLTLHGDMAGTPHFMPPEQITDYRNVRPAADQYAAAAVLYHLLTGQFPLDLPSMPEALVKILHDEPVPIRERNPELPAGLAEAVHRALAKDPAGRFADADEFRRALLPFG